MTIHIIFKQNLTLYTVQYICSKNKFAEVLHNIETLSHFHMPNRPKKCVFTHQLFLRMAHTCIKKSIKIVDKDVVLVVHSKQKISFGTEVC